MFETDVEAQLTVGIDHMATGYAWSIKKTSTQVRLCGRLSICLLTMLFESTFTSELAKHNLVESTKTKTGSKSYFVV